MPQNSLFLFENLDISNREVVSSQFPTLPQVVARRTIPGILIFTVSDELVYINTEAREILSSMAANSNGPQHNNHGVVPFMIPVMIPETVTNLCTHLKLMVSSYKLNTSNTEQKQTPSVLALSTTGAVAYSFRSFFLSNNQNDGKEEGYILVLIERVSQAKKINMAKAAQHYKLSKREIEVVELLLLGYKNKEIAEKLYVCVYTVEDHLKKIMKKMQVSNRTGIIAKLMEVQ
jgi:DNA-binding CsgD family transcriptional regulator